MYFQKKTCEFYVIKSSSSCFLSLLLCAQLFFSSMFYCLPLSPCFCPLLSPLISSYSLSVLVFSTLIDHSVGLDERKREIEEEREL